MTRRAAPGEDVLIGSDREPEDALVAILDREMNIMMTRDHKLSRKLLSEASQGHFLISLHTIRLFFPATSQSRPLQAI